VLPEIWITLYSKRVNLRNGGILHFVCVCMFLWVIFSFNSYYKLPVYLRCFGDVQDNLPTPGDVNSYGEVVKCKTSAGGGVVVCLWFHMADPSSRNKEIFAEWALKEP
jgi:hypothetical protein